MSAHTPLGSSGRWGLTAEIADFRSRLDELRSCPGGTTDLNDLWAELETANEELRVADEEVRAQQEELERLASLQRTEHWLHERLIAMLPVAVLVTDGQGVIQTVNAAAAALLRLRVDRMARKPVFTFMEATDRAEVRQLLSRSVSSGDGFRTTATMTPRGSVPIDVELATTVARDERTGTKRVTWVCLRGSGGAVGRDAEEQMLAQCLVELTQQAIGTDKTGTVLTRISRMCQHAFAIQTWVSISLGAPTEPELVATDSKTAQSVDGAQITAGEGPRNTAWEEGATVTSDDLRGDVRWPRLGRALGDSPATAAIAVPLTVGESRFGALTIYSDDPALVNEARVRGAELLAAAIAAVLQETDTKAELADLAENLQEAMRSRAGIEQAKGILMATHGCSADDAFRMLAEASSRTNVKVRVIAARLVEEATQGGEAVTGGRCGPERSPRRGGLAARRGRTAG